MIDLDRLANLATEAELRRSAKPEQIAELRALVAELRAARKVMAAAERWAEECAPGGWGEKEPEKFALYAAIGEYQEATK